MAEYPGGGEVQPAGQAKQPPPLGLPGMPQPQLPTTQPQQRPHQPMQQQMPQQQQQPMMQQQQQQMAQPQPMVQQPMGPAMAMGMGLGCGPRLWAYPSPPIPGVPVGLECLSRLTDVFVLQQVEMMEMVTNWETNNRYEVVDAEGHRLFFAMEATGMMDRQLWGSNRRFEMGFYDSVGREVVHLSRQAGGMGAGACCGVTRELVVSSPPGKVIGFILQTSGGACASLELALTGPERQALLYVTGPGCSLGFQEAFPVVGSDRATQVGSITKYWGGYAKEHLTKADNFGVSFPADLDARVKAQLTAVVILVDFIYFEHQQNNHHHHNHHGGFNSTRSF